MKRWLLGLTMVLCGLSVHGASAQRDMAREQAIEAELQAIAPAQVPNFRAAREALDREDDPAAEGSLRQVLRAAPGFDAAQRRLGGALARMGRRQEALVWCRRAVAVRRSGENLVTLAHALGFAKDEVPKPAEQQEALRLLEECRKLPQGQDEDVLVPMAFLALEVNDRDRFQAALGDLRKSHPDLMQTHYLQAIAAAMGEHWQEAEREIRLAQAQGLPEETVQRFLDSGVGSRARAWRLAGLGGGLVALWAVGLLGIFLLGFVLSRITARSAERGDLEGRGGALRGIYRGLMALSGFYYYLSLPVVVLVVAGVAGGVLYLCLLLGQIPIKLILILGLGVLATLWAMGRSLLVRVRFEDPGRPVARQEAEGLWELVEEVARTVGTRPVDEIRLTTGTDLAVYENGTWMEKWRDRGRRVLLLGAGVLHGFRQEDFRCVLAHEYGHFSHRDTAGGEIALRVRRDILHFARAMAEAGQATYYNLAFHFLRLYHFLFQRISHGATRLQEILADRVAAAHYGAPAFEGGLTHVIRQSLAFDATADREIQSAIEARRPLANFYGLAGEAPAEAFQAILGRPTTEDDTHPSPGDRFRLVAAFQAPACPPRSGEVWELFRDPEGLQRELMAEMESRIAPYRRQGEDRAGD